MCFPKAYRPERQMPWGNLLKSFMKSFHHNLLLCSMAVAMSFTSFARYHTPYGTSRIYWDMSSKTMLFPSGTYARIIELHDGRLLAVGESGGGISINWSNDKGRSWEGRQLIVPNAPGVPYAVPDVIQLHNGEIIVGFNPRPSAPYDESRKFGIRCVRSSDNGTTWSDPIFIYDASHLGSEGCWEPCFLELPTGELQCYFANENNFPYSGEQEISVCRSFDGGLSWGSASRVCFSNGSRDGMPVPILTDDNDIVVVIEDNGWGGYNGFRTTAVRSTLEDNWSTWAGRDHRFMVFANDHDKKFISAAPYIRRLGSDETIVSWQGDRGERIGMGESHFEMSVGVGNKVGCEVKAISSPFALPTTQHGLWNSVTALDDGTVFAVSSIGEPGKGEVIYAMTGYAMTGFNAAFGTPTINGTTTNENWTKENARQVFLGCNATGNAAAMDFLYDNEFLYFTANVEDRKIVSSQTENDGITLALDTKNASDAYPQAGMHRFFLDCDGSVKYMYGYSNRWVDAPVPEGINYSVNVKRTSYSVEVAIPWQLLGFESAPVGNDMRCYIDIHDCTSENVLYETIPEADVEKSWTWPGFNLLPNENNGIESISPNTPADGSINVVYENGTVKVHSSRDISEINIYSPSGLKVCAHKCSGKSACINVSHLKGVFIVETRDSKMKSKISKLAIL